MIVRDLDRDPAFDPRKGDRLTFPAGEVRVDRVANGWVYFVSWRGDEEIGDPRRMEQDTWRRAVLVARGDMTLVAAQEIQAVPPVEPFHLEAVHEIVRKPTDD